MPPGPVVPDLGSGTVTGPVSVTAVPFALLSPRQAHDLWWLRQDVFVVEQECAYPDLDGRDVETGTRHVLLTEDAADPADDGPLLLGCARVLDDGEQWRIGRLALARRARGRGLAHVLMATALEVTPERDVVLDAQSPLAGFYAGHGFVVDGAEFLEDGIAHLPMRRRRA